jgi:hypothetical protein
VLAVAHSELAIFTISASFILVSFDIHTPHVYTLFLSHDLGFSSPEDCINEHTTLEGIPGPMDVLQGVPKRHMGIIKHILNVRYITGTIEWYKDGVYHH